jgi:2-dehydro-3-deoxyglucarate aldolase/4-hydroxy-2-oxoheptanedioate aldolase
MPVRIKDALGEGRLLRVFGVGQLCHPKVVEIVGLQAAWDAVWLDQEHTGLTIGQIEDATRAARAIGIDVFVRVAPSDYATVMRPLEAGASGIMAAMIRSARQTAEVVRWAKFFPMGERGVNGTGVDGRYGSYPSGDYFRKANADTFVGIQIETADALNEVEQIAAVPGVDFLFVGPADLSQSLGLPGQWEHPRMWEAIARVARACAERKIAWAILPPDGTYARRCVEQGCRMLSIGFDVWALHKGLRATRADYGDLFDEPVVKTAPC